MTTVSTLDSSDNLYFPIEKNGNVYIAKYSSDNNLIWGGVNSQPVVNTTEPSKEAYYCNKLLFPSWDETFFYAIVTKNFAPFIGFRSQGIVSLLKIRKDTGILATITNLTTNGFADGLIVAAGMIPTESKFYVVDGSTIKRYSFDGTFDANLKLSVSYALESLVITKTNIFAYGTKNATPVLLMLPNDLSAEFESSYDIGATLDSTAPNSMVLTNQGIFTVAQMDVAFGKNNTALIKWDIANGKPTLVKDYGSSMRFSNLLSDDSDGLYASDGYSIHKISPITGEFQWNTAKPTDETNLDMAIINNGELIVAYSTKFSNAIGYINFYSLIDGSQK